MKKRLFSILLALALTLALLPVGAMAASGEYGQLPIYIGHADVDYMAQELLSQIDTRDMTAPQQIQAVCQWIGWNFSGGQSWFSEASVKKAVDSWFYDQCDAAVEAGQVQIRGDYDAIFSAGEPTYDANEYVSRFAQEMMMARSGDEAHTAALTALLLGHLGYDCRVIQTAEGAFRCYVLVEGSYQLLSADGTLSPQAAQEGYAAWLQAQASLVAEQYAYSAALAGGESWSRCSGWAEDQMRRAAQLGLIPQALEYRNLREDISRAEFAAVAVALYEKLSGKEAQNYMTSSPFSDTEDREVLKAYCLGVVNGVGNGKFDPDSTLTRQQAVTMLGRVYGLVRLGEVSDGSGLNTGAAPLFADDGQIASYARDYIYFFVSAGMINGVGGNQFAPTQTMKRQEALKTTVEAAN